MQLIVKNGKILANAVTCFLYFASFVALTACSVEQEKNMDASNQPTFNDPALQRAAEALLAGESERMLAEASARRDSIDAVDREGSTLLKIALKRNYEAAVKALLALKANPDLPHEAAPIGAAVELANIEIVKLLLKAGANPNGSTNGESALWRAAMGNRREVAEILLQSGAQIDHGDEDGETPVMAAVQASHFQLAIFLLERGASPSAKSGEGENLAYWARQSRINPNNEEGQARERLLSMLGAADARQ